MKVYAISDLHLSINNPKPMDIFGPVWNNYFDEIVEDWNSKVQDDDIVLLAGDLSWAMKLEDAVVDIKLLENLKGTKVILRGNHDYWWSTISKVRNILPKNIYAIQNDSLVIGEYIICGSRGWIVESAKLNNAEDKKIYDRELIRLEMSLKDAKAKQTNGQKIICMMHFPPYDKFNNPTDFTKLIENYGVDTVVFGHIHGKIPGYKKLLTLNGVNYYLTSCDMVGNKLIEIL